MQGKRLNICIVDDDSIYQFTVRKTIEAMSFNVNINSFTKPAEAIIFLEKYCMDAGELPDIILLDVNMPIMDGWQFLDAYKLLKETLCKHISIYMVSSSVDQDDIRKSKEFYGVHDYIVKPIHREKFREILQPFATA